METAELLSSFNEHLASYSSHREYVRRAQAMAERFSPGVIEKVVLDHELRSTSVAEEILPLVPNIEARVAEIDAEKATIEEGKATSDAKMEELTLRQAIGEISDEEFDSLGQELRQTLDEANGRLDILNGERDELTGALGSWVELAAEANQNDGVASGDESEVVVEEEAVDDDEEDLLSSGDTLMGDGAMDDSEEPQVEDNEGQHASTASIKEDMSAVFDNNLDSAASIQVDDAAGEDIEAGDDGVDYGFPVGDDEGEVELNLDGGAVGGDDTGDEIGIDLDVGIDDDGAEAAEEGSEGEEGGDQDEDRRAILLYSEGSPDEQMYPFPGDVLSIGRGRDNDIQIKNDSKVSRFHCRLFRRGGKFYIEDNKSSNGTLVNGELITERLLFGGEEIIIGETFFRFRIM
ncbi:MAG: hypothetical protein CL927_08710 [Deltaproteobacteria bacterium]|nr:hypothetical protein [Deltaproteobacteria bacterium]HCH62265.1 hypothetical protein [Deltaproteobacteria bacterium]